MAGRRWELWGMSSSSTGWSGWPCRTEASGASSCWRIYPGTVPGCPGSTRSSFLRVPREDRTRRSVRIRPCWYHVVQSVPLAVFSTSPGSTSHGSNQPRFHHMSMSRTSKDSFVRQMGRTLRPSYMNCLVLPVAPKLPYPMELKWPSLVVRLRSCRQHWNGKISVIITSLPVASAPCLALAIYALCVA